MIDDAAPCSCPCHGSPSFHVAHVAPCCDADTAEATEEFRKAQKEDRRG